MDCSFSRLEGIPSTKPPRDLAERKFFRQLFREIPRNINAERNSPPLGLTLIRAMENRDFRSFGARKSLGSYDFHDIFSLYRLRNVDYRITMQGYSSLAIARFFLQKAFQEGKHVTPMKILKLVFIAHGWHLGFFKKPLISESIQAWKYGPVIPALYRYFKEYGSNPIPSIEMDILPEVPTDMEPETKRLLDRVWEKYSPLSAIQLSALTHQQGTPWHQATNGGTCTAKFLPIPNEVIQDFYQKKVGV
jgi:uncharacterized phage-associated protein